MRPLLILAALLCLKTSAAAEPPSGAPLGISYVVWTKQGYAQADEYLERLKSLGFGLVAFVPNYTQVDLNRLDFSSAPAWDDYTKAVGDALDKGFSVVLMPHIEPDWSFDSFASDNHSWRMQAPWRGYLDIDPMSEDYREKVIGRSLEMLHDIYAKRADAKPIRLDLGAELMNSEVYLPDRWEGLLAYARHRIAKLGLKGRVLLSHNFTHHFQIPNDFVLRMRPEGRRALARYIKGLDGIALSQYMDLTVAVPAAERGTRLPTAEEVGYALVIHENNFRDDVLEKHLGLKPGEIPPLYLDEFAICCGGLRFPNVYQCKKSPEREAAWNQEAALGYQGLTKYLALGKGRWARSAILWVGGGPDDLFMPTSSSPGVKRSEDELQAYLQQK